MRLIHGDGPDEPEDGWVSSPRRYDNEIVTTSLCRFTGQHLEPEQKCFARDQLLHPDLDCRTSYAALPAVKAMSLSEVFQLPDELRKPTSWGR